MGIYDVPASELIERAAKELKALPDLKAPAWSAFAKTGPHNERPPVREDWWHVRAAAILRKLAILGPIGVSKLRVKYGGRKNRGYAPERFRECGGNHIRKILQQLEKAGFAGQEKKSLHKGRILLPKGMSFLDKIASAIMKERGIVLPKRPDISTLIMKKPDKKARPVKKAVPTVTPSAEGAASTNESTVRKPRAPKKKVEPTSPGNSSENTSANQAPSQPEAKKPVRKKKEQPLATPAAVPQDNSGGAQ